MIGRLVARARRTVSDIRNGRHVEAYVLFAIGLVLAILGLLDFANVRIVLTGVLLGISFLIFHSTETASADRSIGSVLFGRESFAPFQSLLKDARVLWVYGPTAVNVLVNVADIRRHVVERGGSVRFILQDPNSSSVALTEMQLDDNTDFRQALAGSVATLTKLAQATAGAVEYRLLGVNPGFSVIVVNPHDHDAYLIVETHGFRDENISDRMHIVIHRRESVRWFAYWLKRFEEMWSAARIP